MDQITIILIAESNIRRAGLAALLEGYPRINLLGVFSVDSAFDHLNSVDGIIIDWDDADADNFRILSQRLSPEIAIILLADEITEELSFEDSQLKALLPRDVATGDLEFALESLETDLIVIHPLFTRTKPLTALLKSRPILNNESPKLTNRELEVLEWLSSGYTNKEIADHLGISNHTIKFHITSIFTKLNVSSRTEAAAMGLRLGLVKL